MRTLLSIISFSFLHISAFAQKEIKFLAPIINRAGTVLFINYPDEHNPYNDMRAIVLKGHIDSTIFKSGYLLTGAKRKKLNNILIDPKTFTGRYASCDGCGPNQAILLWHKGKYSFIELITASHKAFYSGTNSYFYIDEYKNDILKDFLKTLHN